MPRWNIFRNFRVVGVRVLPGGFVRKVNRQCWQHCVHYLPRWVGRPHVWVEFLRPMPWRDRHTGLPLELHRVPGRVGGRRGLHELYTVRRRKLLHWDTVPALPCKFYLHCGGFHFMHKVQWGVDVPCGKHLLLVGVTLWLLLRVLLLRNLQCSVPRVLPFSNHQRDGRVCSHHIYFFRGHRLDPRDLRERVAAVHAVLLPPFYRARCMPGDWNLSVICGVARPDRQHGEFCRDDAIREWMLR